MPDIIDTAMLTLRNAMESTTAAIEGFGDQWDNKLAELKAKGKEFNTLFDELKNKENFVKQFPTLYENYLSLMKKGEWIRDTISTITRGVDYGTNLLFGTTKPPINKMGALQLVPIAVMVSALSAVSAWIASAYVELEKIQTAERLSKEKGVDPVKFLESAEGKSFAGETGKFFKGLTPILFFIGIGWIFKDDIKRLFKNKLGAK